MFKFSFISFFTFFVLGGFIFFYVWWSLLLVGEADNCFLEGARKKVAKMRYFCFIFGRKMRGPWIFLESGVGWHDFFQIFQTFIRPPPVIMTAPLEHNISGFLKKKTFCQDLGKMGNKKKKRKARLTKFSSNFCNYTLLSLPTLASQCVENQGFKRPKTKICITEVGIFSEKLISVPPFIKHPRVVILVATFKGEKQLFINR